MIGLLAVLVFSQAIPDTSLKLKLGDVWSGELTSTYRSVENTICNVETISYAVVKEGNKTFLKAMRKLKETRMENGDVIPAPPKIQPLVSKITIDGQELIREENEDAQLYRLERFLNLDRKGKLTEPTFFAIPANVRLIGMKRIDERDPKVKDEYSFTSSLYEVAGEKPMKGLAVYELDKTSGILKKAVWQIVNAPIPSGPGLWDLDISWEIKNLKLAPRP